MSSKRIFFAALFVLAACLHEVPTVTTPVGKNGPALVGTVTNEGGTVSRLYFAVLGDSRPALEDDTDHYPTETVRQIYSDVETLSPRPQFAVVTGDYVYASPQSDEATKQMNMYLSGRAAFSNPVFFSMGNHECTGPTTSNCGFGGNDLVSKNYTAFLDTMLAPLGQSKAYYMIRVNGTDGTWTSKVVVAAPNAWSVEQERWFQNVMAIPTTYTFVVRHEPTGARNAPTGVQRMDSILARTPCTLLLEGHEHEYEHSVMTKELIMGLGGAPPSSIYDFGYVIIEQDAAGDLLVSEYDCKTRKLNDAFKIHADGSQAQ